MKSPFSMTRCPSPPARLRQRGIALIVALIALVAISMAGIALVRSVGTGLEISGNLAFREVSKNAADVATDVAVNWIATNNSALSSSAPASGYFANWLAGCDITGNRTPNDKTDDVGWTGAAGAACTDPLHGGAKGQAIPVSGMPSGYTASYIVTRMCFCEGSATGYCTGTQISNTCVGIASAGRFHETATYDNRGLSGEEAGRIAAGVSPYYRIVTRVAGPRNTVSFIETMVTLDN